MSGGQAGIVEFDGIQFVKLHTPEDGKPVCETDTDNQLIGPHEVAADINHGDWCEDCRRIVTFRDEYPYCDDCEDYHAFECRHCGAATGEHGPCCECGREEYE